MVQYNTTPQEIAMGIFWYTGWVVWAVIAAVVAVAAVVGAIVGTCTAYRLSKEWVGLKMLTALCGVSADARISVVKAVGKMADAGVIDITKISCAELADVLTHIANDDDIINALKHKPS